MDIAFVYTLINKAIANNFETIDYDDLFNLIEFKIIYRISINYSNPEDNSSLIGREYRF